MEHQEFMKILNSIWEDEEKKSLYYTAVRITEQARYPHLYENFKLSWNGEKKEEYEKGLQALKECGWVEPGEGKV